MKTNYFNKKYVMALVLIFAGVYCLYIIPEQIQLSWNKLYLMLGGLLFISIGISMTTNKNVVVFNIARIFTGILFTYSGFVKAVDPLGSKYKFIDYFEAWGIDYMAPTAFTLGIILSALEFTIGLALFFNIKIKWVSVLAMIFMLIFTPITLYLALQEHVSGKELVHDCGCFGDALILTNWQTFLKNIIILIPTVFVFIKRNKRNSFFNQKASLIFYGIYIGLSITISIHAYRHLPFIDFRPYHVGADIKEGIKGIPDEQEQWAKFKNIETGEIKEFEIMRNYPDWNKWEYIADQKIRIEITKKGKTPSIHDFSINNRNSEDVTDSILLDTNYNFMFIAYDIELASQQEIKHFNQIYTLCKENKLPFRAITASLQNQIINFKKKTGVQFPFYTADPITLKTIIRANPGLVLLKDGIIINKWHYNNLPTYEEIQTLCNH